MHTALHPISDHWAEEMLEYFNAGVIILFSVGPEYGFSPAEWQHNIQYSDKVQADHNESCWLLQLSVYTIYYLLLTVPAAPVTNI